MFFTFSKILAFLISPINWIAFVFIYALIAHKPARKKKAWILAAVLFFVFTNGLLVNRCMKWLEVESIGLSEVEQTYDFGILLGGMILYQSDTNQISFNSNGDRLFQTIELYYSGKIEKILISSGSGLMQLPSFRESYLIKKYLMRTGIPESDILIETLSRNTHENAVETKRVLQEIYGEEIPQEFLLITSASHMRRASACFEKIGVRVIPYSTTKRKKRPPFILESEMILPNPDAFRHWQRFFKEVIGLAAYKLTGYI